MQIKAMACFQHLGRKWDDLDHMMKGEISQAMRGPRFLPDAQFPSQHGNKAESVCLVIAIDMTTIPSFTTHTTPGHSLTSDHNIVEHYTNAAC